MRAQNNLTTLQDQLIIEQSGAVTDEAQAA
jgi:hypothetical protein